LVHQKYAWRRNYFSPVCTAATIAAITYIGIGTGSLACYAGGSCSSFTTVPADVYCTDFSVNTDYSLGEHYDTFTLPLGAKFVIAFASNAWLPLAIGGNGAWQVVGQINLVTRPDGILNTSPVTSTLPVIYRTINVQHVHVVQMSDADSTDTLRCRWATNNSPANANGYDECGSVCAPSLPTGFTLFANNCTLVYTITAPNYYAVALQIEDFYTSSSTVPLSSVPIQFLFYGIPTPANCSTPPSIIGVRPNLGLILFKMLL
jgi:hypothetical protein